MSDAKIDPKTPLISVSELVTVQSKLLGIGSTELAARVGFASVGSVSMIKRGRMKLPMDKVSAMAQALQIDPIYLARCVDAEAGGRTVSVLEAILNRVAITDSESWLVGQLREVAKGRDIDLRQYPDELQAVIRAWSAACLQDHQRIQGLGQEGG